MCPTKDPAAEQELIFPEAQETSRAVPRERIYRRNQAKLTSTLNQKIRVQKLKCEEHLIDSKKMQMDPAELDLIRPPSIHQPEPKKRGKD